MFISQQRAEDILLGLTPKQMTTLFASTDIEGTDISRDSFMEVENPYDFLTAEEVRGSLHEESAKQGPPTILDHLVNMGMEGSGQEKVQRFAEKIQVWLKNSDFPQEKKDQILERLLMQVARKEAQFFSRDYRSGDIEGSPQKLIRDFFTYCPLSAALKAQLSPERQAVVIREIQADIAEPTVTHLQRVNQLKATKKKMVATASIYKLEHYSVLNAQISGLRTTLTKLEDENSRLKRAIDKGVQQNPDLLRELRPGIFARNFTSWGKQAEKLYQNMVATMQKRDDVETTAAMAALMACYQQASTTMTGAERVFYLGSVTARQEVAGDISNSVDRTIERRNANKQQMRQIQAEITALQAQKGELQRKMGGAVDFDYSSHQMQALGGQVEGEHRSLQWRDEAKQGAPLQEVREFDKKDAPAPDANVSTDREPEKPAVRSSPGMHS